jgi:Rrf2 family iron-sulfur cluster assembly transcriptional regulator
VITDFFSSKFLSAIKALLCVALYPGTKRISCREIGSTLGVSARHLEAILQQLVRAGILRGERGPKGGYALARERRKTTLADIFDAIYTAAENEKNKSSDFDASLHRVLRPHANLIYSTLKKTTLEDLCNESSDLSSTLSAPNRADFTI